MTLIRIDAGTRLWDEVVRSMTDPNIYQSAVYHRLAAEMDGGQASLLFFEKEHRRVAIPLVTREIDNCLASSNVVLRDARSVYGYPGILSNVDDFPPEFIHRFHEVLQQEMERENVVSVFVRLGVFRTGMNLIDGLGQVEKLGETVAIDLSVSNEIRFKNYRRNHRTDIRRLRSLGATTSDDPRFERLADFENAYALSMRRASALEWFNFGLPYFRDLCTSRPDDVVLLHTSIDGQMASAGLFFCTGDIVYAHLTATTEQWIGKSPTKVLFDDAASYFQKRGCKWLQLGGGLGAQNDSLYRYKRGFSKTHIPFHVWKYVVDPQRYQELCTAKEDKKLGQEHRSGFFPQYRAHRDNESTVTAESSR